MHCHFDADSILNSLMVTASNIALGGTLRMYKDRAAFERAMRLAANSSLRSFAKAG